VIVPGYHQTNKDKYDPTNLLLLEATSGGGIVARPLLTRLEMSQSRTVLLLPLHLPGDTRTNSSTTTDQEEDVLPERTQRLLESIESQLTHFRDVWIEQSKAQGYARAHASLSILGALGYALGLQDVSRAPVSPSAWVVVSALRQAGIAENINDRTALETKVEDFLRDHRFHEEHTVRLRPGFKFLPPVIMRELSRS
jgi:hypothetical protein